MNEKIVPEDELSFVLSDLYTKGHHVIAVIPTHLEAEELNAFVVTTYRVFLVEA